ncbi:C40 family peptidase [Enterococcus gallinarum]|uniref:C40 family peptidase n=1 Tax=Enterococcus TaxID=1350 RepID=UPI003BF8B960
MKKAVQAAMTFLWKQPQQNAVLTKINAQPLEAVHSFLSAADAMTLYEEDLVDSEILYGTVVEVVQEKEEWAEIIVLDQASNKNLRGYPGYVPSNVLTVIDEKYGLGKNQKVAVIKPTAVLQFKDHQRILSFGTLLDWLFEDAEWYHVMTPEGPAEISKTQAQRIDQGNSTTPRQLIEMAEQFLDLPYVWAGISSSGFDCSGFMYSLHRVNGILIPRDTIEQAQAGVQRSYEQAQPGDLLLFAYEEGKGKVHHVGLYLGADEMIHSQTPGSKVMKTKITGSAYEPELAVVTRYID